MNKGGNPGYGKMKVIEANINKFSPKFWKLMEEFAASGDLKKQTIFITEFNKIQAKMIPQIVGGDPENPIIFMPSDLMSKNGINQDPISPNATTSSSGYPPVSNSELRPEVGQDDTSSVGDDSQSSSEGQSTDNLPSSNLPTS